jgi:hypothetical protein
MIREYRAEREVRALLAKTEDEAPGGKEHTVSWMIRTSSAPPENGGSAQRGVNSVVKSCPLSFLRPAPGTDFVPVVGKSYG